MLKKVLANEHHKSYHGILGFGVFITYLLKSNFVRAISKIDITES